MSIYRAESGRRAVLMLLGGAIAGLVLGIVIGRVTAPGLADQVADLRSRAAPIVSSLEVVRTEYPKLLAGGEDPGGAEAAIARARSLFTAVRPSLAELDAQGTDDLAAAIEAVEASIATRAPAAEVAAAADAMEAQLVELLPLTRSN